MILIQKNELNILNNWSSDKLGLILLFYSNTLVNIICIYTEGNICRDNSETVLNAYFFRSNSCISHIYATGNDLNSNFSHAVCMWKIELLACKALPIAYLCEKLEICRLVFTFGAHKEIVTKHLKTIILIKCENEMNQYFVIVYYIIWND